MGHCAGTRLCAGHTSREGAAPLPFTCPCRKGCQCRQRPLRRPSQRESRREASGGALPRLLRATVKGRQLSQRDSPCPGLAVSRPRRLQLQHTRVLSRGPGGCSWGLAAGMRGGRHPGPAGGGAALPLGGGRDSVEGTSVEMRSHFWVPWRVSDVAACKSSRVGKPPGGRFGDRVETQVPQVSC